jgi:hypothetical protein
MFINLSNHPSTFWEKDQINAASLFGSISDLPFPTISPDEDTDTIARLAESYEVKVRKLLAKEPIGLFAVHVMGEFTFCFSLVARLQKAGILCFASTTRRQTINHTNGSKTSKFVFVAFREYPNINAV